MSEGFRCPYNPTVICNWGVSFMACMNCKISYAETEKEDDKHGDERVEKV